jgi:hypothetical protein
MQDEGPLPNEPGKLEGCVADTLFYKGIPIASRTNEISPTKTPGQVIQDYFGHLIGEWRVRHPPSRAGESDTPSGVGSTVAEPDNYRPVPIPG